jgi:hypothetical protein
VSDRGLFSKREEYRNLSLFLFRESFIYDRCARWRRESVSPLTVQGWKGSTVCSTTGTGRPNYLCRYVPMY